MLENSQQHHCLLLLILCWNPLKATPRTGQNLLLRNQAYATPPPSYVSMRSSMSNNSILRQSQQSFRQGFLKSDARSSAGNRTPDIVDDVSPYDSVSNFDESDEAMETSFGADKTAENNVTNMSFGSDVGSMLSATLDTSVQVCSKSYLLFFKYGKLFPQNNGCLKFDWVSKKAFI